MYNQIVLKLYVTHSCGLECFEKFIAFFRLRNWYSSIS
jgi:hypothetical protein